jgi:hypothetical protein
VVVWWDRFTLSHSLVVRLRSTSLLSVEQEIEFIAYTCGLCDEKCINGSTRRQT